MEITPGKIEHFPKYPQYIPQHMRDLIRAKGGARNI